MKPLTILRVGLGRLVQVGDEVVALSVLLQTREHHLGAGDELLGVLQRQGWWRGGSVGRVLLVISNPQQQQQRQQQQQQQQQQPPSPSPQQQQQQQPAQNSRRQPGTGKRPWTGTNQPVSQSDSSCYLPAGSRTGSDGSTRRRSPCWPSCRRSPPQSRTCG
jgi:hypothetical protein